ncbi:respiratory chain complex I subunit 1 family protein [Methanogenium sp. MK-MG]|uniref:respiratory chain complex I subunit 1 family protein n=1 Tax=Methanogenium sp. MK-MG TaxID=2599926 RepID=UPI0013EC4DAF|nr:NADH-quinone oxidoreductase subunit H [Methanogenium sp. MK-MG]KAF1074811.1 NAD(P)H-quinone oxidoreductase subunit 1, chloroplastic [Methanogenium sp. MK-MG]
MIGYLIAAPFIGLLFMGIHRKAIARIQGRPGPPVWQEILHTLKFSFKETWVPRTASKPLYIGIVVIAIAIWVGALYIVMLGGSLLLLFGVYMVHKMVEHGVGLSPGSPYAKFGGVRSVISASSEIPLFAVVAGIYFFTGSLMISDIVQYQADNGPLLFSLFPAAIAMYIVILSKMHYGPFSIVEAKEIVSGYKTEHFGVWRAGLEISDAIKTFVLLMAFVLIFWGALSPVLLFIAMLIILISLSFVCALTPMLSPYDSVTVQLVTIVILVAWMAILGLIA